MQADTGQSPRDAEAAKSTNLISSWQPRPQLAAKQMLAKYGPPQEASAEQLIWRNAGPFKRITVTKMEHPHDFPLPHMDYLEHTINYRVPADKAAALSAYDGSLTVDRTRGEMSARCDLEAHNILTLNLAHDIVMGKSSAEDARKEFGEIVVKETMGSEPAYVKELQFPIPTQATEFVDQPVIPGAPKRAAAMGEKAKGNKDGEILGLIVAVNRNEVLAASHATMENLNSSVRAYAKMLHEEHGANLGKTLKLGQSIDVTPMVTPEVDKLRVKGADDLGELVPLDGERFGAAYLDAEIKGHMAVQNMIDNQLLKQAQHEDVKQHLMETRKHVATHLATAKQVQDSLRK